MSAAENITSILICENDALMADNLEADLRRLGYQVLGKETSAREALARADEIRPDLVLMDIALEGETDGITAAEIIQTRLDIPVIFLTADTDADRLEQAKPTHPFGYILKPIETRNLKITLKMALFVADADRKRRREETLRNESEARLNLFMNHFPGVAFIKDADGRVVFANDRYYDVGGLNRSEVEGKPYTEYLPAHIADAFRREDAQVLAHNQTLEVEQMFPTEKGNTYWLTKKYPIHRQDAPPLIGGIAIDVTERVLAQEALRDSEEKFRSISEQMIETVFLTDCDGVITYMSPMAEEIFGFTAREMVNRHFQTFLDKESVPISLPGFIDVLEKGIPTKNMRLKMLKKNGIRFTGELNGTAYLQHGRVVGTIGVIRDITEQEKSERALKENRANLSALIENSDGSIWSVDRNYRLIMGNSIFHRNITMRRGQPFASGECALPDFEDPPAVTEEWRGYYDRALAGERFSTETVWTYQDRPIYMEHDFNPIRGSEEEITGVAIHGRNITSKKQSEQQLQAALHEKEILLKELNHRVKNNMQVIISLMKLQSDKLQDERIKSVFLESQSRVYAMAAVHESLHQSDNLARIDLSAYIMKLGVTTFQIYRTDSRDITLSVRIDPILVKLEQSYPIGLVINELLSNALKYAFPDGRKGVIRISGKREDNSRVMIEISDDGVGLPAHFDFRRVDSLGLQLVRNLVEGQLGGVISLDATAGARWQMVIPIS